MSTYMVSLVSIAINFLLYTRSRAHIQRTDPTNVGLIQASTEEDGCSLESGDIDEAELLSSQNENVRYISKFQDKNYNFKIICS